MRVRLGAALQKHRLRRGLTQAELAEAADISLKYVGEVERGEANTTLNMLERLAATVGWNPMDAPDGVAEPIPEGVRLFLLEQIEEMKNGLLNMVKWLQALDPALQRVASSPASPATDAATKPRPGKRGQPKRERGAPGDKATST